jgi:2-dehydropantoate 2-reductase
MSSGADPGGKRVLIIGAGAIGGTLGALLSRAGCDVTFLTKTEEAAAEIRSRGMTVHGVRGTFTARPRAEARADELSGPYHAVMAAVKAYDLAGALGPALSLIPRDCPVVSLQNGICVEELEALVGPHRAVGCVVGYGATMHGNAEVELTSEGEMVIGCRAPWAQGQLAELRDLVSLAFPTMITEDILASLYSKLIINSCITTLGALSGRTLGWMLRRRAYRTVFITIMREAMAVARVARIAVPPYAGRLDYEAFLRGEGMLADMRRHLVLRVMGMKYRRLKSSSLQSLERGRPTEVDSFNGYVVQRARALGVAAPLNERLTAMVHEIEKGRRRIEPANMDGVA